MLVVFCSQLKVCGKRITELRTVGGTVVEGKLLWDLRIGAGFLLSWSQT